MFLESKTLESVNKLLNTKHFCCSPHSPSCFPSLSLCQPFVPCSSHLCGTIFPYLSLHAALLLTLSTFIYLCLCSCCLADAIPVAVLESCTEGCSLWIKVSEEVETGHSKIQPTLPVITKSSKWNLKFEDCKPLTTADWHRVIFYLIPVEYST